MHVNALTIALISAATGIGISRCFDRAMRTTASKNFVATSCLSNRSRFLLKVLASHVGSSRLLSSNLRNDGSAC